MTVPHDRVIVPSYVACPAHPMNFRPNLNSITSRFVLLAIAILLAGVLGRVLVLSSFLRKDLTELTSTQLLTLANYVAKDIDHDIVERRELLERVAAKFPTALLDDPNRMQDWLGARIEVNSLFTFGMSVIDTTGTVLANYPPLPNRTGISFADHDYFQQALKGKFAIGRPVIGRIANVPVLPMAVPLRDNTGKVRAVLTGVTALNDPGFLESLNKAHVGATGGLLLISPRDKLYIGASDASMAFKPTPNEGLNALHDQAMNGYRGTGITVNARGVEELVGIASVPSNGWYVVARLPTSEAFAPVTRLRRFMLDNLLILLPILLFLVLPGLRYLLRPLKEAAQHADKMTLGEIPLEPLPVVRDDEVGHLTRAFNRVLSKLLESRSALEHRAHHDPLTELPNRQLLADRMKLALARAQRSEGYIAVLFLDLDGFKPINDQLGHEAGDAALCEVTERLSRAVRREDTLARVGGDEFVVLLSDLTHNARESAELVAKKCLEIFQQPFIIRGQSCRLGTSIGIAMGDGSCSADKLLIAADQAMYRAKNSGRGKFLWADECALCSSHDIARSCRVPHAVTNDARLQ